MSIKVVSLVELRELGREHPDKALTEDEGHPLIGLIGKITLYAMREHLSDEGALSAGLNYYAEQGWKLVSTTATEAILSND